MNNLYLGLLIGFVLASCLWLPGFVLAYRRVIRKKMAEIEYLKQAHQSEFADMIHRMNHEGPIKEGSSAHGLTYLILWAVENSLIILEQLYTKQDWNTMEAISNLRGIAMVELQMLHQKLGDFLEAKRNVLRDFNRQQGL